VGRLLGKRELLVAPWLALAPSSICPTAALGRAPRRDSASLTWARAPGWPACGGSPSRLSTYGGDRASAPRGLVLLAGFLAFPSRRLRGALALARRVAAAAARLGGGLAGFEVLRASSSPAFRGISPATPDRRAGRAPTSAWIGVWGPLSWWSSTTSAMALALSRAGAGRQRCLASACRSPSSPPAPGLCPSLIGGCASASLGVCSPALLGTAADGGDRLMAAAGARGAAEHRERRELGSGGEPEGYARLLAMSRDAATSRERW
jgi:hypothetical protein